jgi:7-cyano-7-deazaguanine reductase
MRGYTEEHAKSGIGVPLPAIECWENQYPGYDIEIVIPEYTAICPKTQLPDFGTLYVTYVPDQWCLELKSLKEYINAFRDIGIFYENAVNRILKDLVAACKPVSMKVRGEFTPRGGIQSRIEARYVRP